VSEPEGGQGDGNVLNGYRTVTYSFTLAALEKKNLDDPESYRGDNYQLPLVILKSGGTGGVQMKRTASTNDPMFNDAAKKEVGTGSPSARRNPGPQTHSANSYADKFFQSFNEKSPGRFDMFMENVEIESIISPSGQNNVSQSTKIKFDVIEPYSINGFIEALYTAAVAAGFPSYLGAPFLLKLEFWGYPDNELFPDPVKIPNSTRYFPMSFTEANIEITEKGTLYRCNAVPYNERGFGHPNVIKKPIKMEGKKVGDLLKNLFKSLNEFSKEIQKIEDEEAKVKSKDYDKYEVKFPTWDDTKGWVYDKENDIAGSKMGDVLSGGLAVMNPPEAPGFKWPWESDAPAGKSGRVPFQSGKSSIQFDQDTNISEIITNIVRDSEYAINLLKQLGKKPGVPDQYGFVNYWTVRVEIKNSNELNTLAKRPFQTFTYLVCPHKIHYTSIPNYGHERINEKDLKKIANRVYNFMYTGQNIDVLNFKLNFNNLFFEAVPVGMGTTPIAGSRNSAAPNNTSEVKTKSNDSTDSSDGNRSQIPDPPVKIISAKLEAYNGNADQPKEDPYQLMARHTHDAIVNSKASMLTGEIEILGDPFYLSTAGAGNWNPKPGKRGQTQTGEANPNYGVVMIVVNFRNPEDINSFEEGGMFRFDGNRVPFSGVYQVTTIISTFKNGEFKQKLELVRLPGQVLDSNLRSSDPADRLSLKPKPGAQLVPDTTLAIGQGQRPYDSATVSGIFDRGLPTPTSNFTAAPGGLGGAALSQLTSALPLSQLPAPGIDLLNQTPGLSTDLSKVSSVIGNPLPTDVASNIRINTSGLANLGQTALTALGAAASVSAAVNIAKAAFTKDGLTSIVGGALAATAANSISKLSNPGSGIGAGASVLISSLLPSSPTANDIKQGLNIDQMSLPLGSISKTISGIGSTNLPNVVNGLGSDAANLVSGVGNKLTALTSLPTDPQAIAAKLGVDPAKLSGIGGSLLQSKFPSQVNDLISKIPGNVNLKQAADQGLALDFIPSTKIANIPATPPIVKAPIAQPDPAYLKQVVEQGGTKALQNLYGVNSMSKLSTNLVPADLIATAEQAASKARLNNPLANLTGLTNAVDLNAAKDKLGSFQNQLSGLTGQVKIPDIGAASSVVSQFGNLSGQVNLPSLNSVGAVATQFGANALKSSPLGNLLKNNNNT
jgi:hypothetical protein